MKSKKPETLDLEQERKKLIQELNLEFGPKWADHHKPGSFGCHELLDRAAWAEDFVEQYVFNHPACINNREWFELATMAVGALSELYVRIGEVHLNNDSKTTDHA